MHRLRLAISEPEDGAFLIITGNRGAGPEMRRLR
jgi:hypothetical protein